MSSDNTDEPLDPLPLPSHGEVIRRAVERYNADSIFGVTAPYLTYTIGPARPINLDDLVTAMYEFADKEARRRLDQIKPTSDAEKLAVAVLKGDGIAALALADLVHEQGIGGVR